MQSPTTAELSKGTSCHAGVCSEHTQVVYQRKNKYTFRLTFFYFSILFFPPLYRIKEAEEVPSTSLQNDNKRKLPCGVLVVKDLWTILFEAIVLVDKVGGEKRVSWLPFSRTKPSSQLYTFSQCTDLHISSLILVSLCRRTIFGHNYV
jgi:hypothetical protein